MGEQGAGMGALGLPALPSRSFPGSPECFHPLSPKREGLGALC